MALPFYHVGLRNPAQFIRISESCLYVPNHYLSGPYNSFFWKSGKNIEIHTFNFVYISRNVYNFFYYIKIVIYMNVSWCLNMP